MEWSKTKLQVCRATLTSLDLFSQTTLHNFRDAPPSRSLAMKREPHQAADNQLYMGAPNYTYLDGSHPVTPQVVVQLATCRS